MAEEMFSFIALRGARPLAVDHWRQVRTRQPDVPLADVVADPATSRPEPREPFDVNVVACLEALSWWLLGHNDRRTPDA